MTALTHSLSSAHRRETSPATHQLGYVLLLSFACTFLGWGAGASTVQAAPDRAQTRARTGTVSASPTVGTTASGAVAFPAAAGIRPGTGPVGPVQMPVEPGQIAPELNALSSYAHPDDGVIFDRTNAVITVLGGGFNNTLGATTVVASTSVGTSTNNSIPFHTNVTQGCVSPSQQLYYWDNVLLAFVAIDLTQASFPRTLVPVPATPALVPGSFDIDGNPLMVWDYSTNTILYLDNGASTAKSTITRGLYRLNPVTGTNTLVASGFVAGTINSLAIKQDGSAIYVFNQNGNTFGPNASVGQIAPNGAVTVVDGGTALYGTTATNPRYYEAVGISWDIVNQKINVYDAGDDQGSSRIIRVDPSARTRSFISNGSSGPAATRDTKGIISAPADGFTTTAGRIVYAESDANVTVKFPAYIDNGSPNVTRIGTTNYSYYAFTYSYVPPTLPTIATPTAVAGANGTTETLGANVTGAGTALVTPTVQTRGVVYALSATNSNPTIGGTGVTQVPATAATGTFTVSATGLTSGTQYSYAAYVSTAYGTVYTPVSTFVTATLATVTTSAATTITGTSAALGGNVTSDGSSTITARGVVYSATNTNPIIGASGVTNLPDGTATTGAYTDTASGLANGTTYYIRAYVTNGVGTNYGTVLTFKTIAAPTANSQSVSVAFNTATAITLTSSDPNTPAQTLTYSVASQPAHGTLSGTAPNLTYTPTSGYNGTDSFTFTTTNTSGLTSNTATVTITVAAGTPTANAQSVSVPFNTATPVTLTATDPDVPALTLTYTVVAAPAHGTLTGTAPNLTYTPTANYQGADSFTFRASNGTNTSNTATVSITVAAGTPTANAQSVTTAFNTAKAITLTGTDPDSPALALTYTVATAPAHGTLSGTAPNLTYTPTANYSGADSFTFTVSNGQKTSTAATVSITVTAGTPSANAQTVSVPFNTAIPVTLTGTDPDSPALPLTYTVLTAPTHGTLSGTAPNLTYTPTANYQGADSFTFRVSNGTNTSNTATVSITVAAGTPTANAQSVNVSFNTATAVTLTGTDPDSPALALTYTVATAPTHGTLSGTAPNLTYTPTAGYQGTDSFTFTVSNGQKTSTAATVSITVAAGTPTANAQTVNAYLNQPKTITLAGTDPDSPALALTYTVVTSPANGTLSGTAPNLTYTPATGFSGTDSFTFTVSNGQKTSTTATVSITVFGAPFVSGFTASGTVGSTVTITGSQFTGATGVTFFRNVAATTFTVVSDTQITVPVPTGATTGTLRVTTPAGTTTTTTKFTVVTP